MLKKCAAIWALVPALLFALPAPLSAQTPASFLIVEGAIRNGEPAADGRLRKVFTEAQILALPTSSITTQTEWRPKSEFVGPSLASVLAAAGARLTEHSRIQLTALNDYSIVIPVSDIARYNPVLAHTVAGKRLVRRDFGPLWLMYPRDSFDELRNNASSSAKLIWQVTRITVL